MRIRLLLATLVTILGLGFSPALLAQSQNQPPSVSDIKEEQRIIGNANLGDAEFQIKEARERLGAKNPRLAQQSGLWALEQLAYAKRRLERHAPRIEEARNLFGFRASEGTLQELRASYRKLRDHYSDVEEKLDALALVLQQAGYSILSQTLEKVRSSGGDGAVAEVQKALSLAGQHGRGDQAGPAPAGETPPGPAQTNTSPVTPQIPGLPDATVTQSDPSHVTVNIPGVGPVSMEGKLSADGKYVDTAEFGRIDLGSGRRLADGSVAFQSDKGLVVLGKDGKWHLVPGAQLNSDGTATTADGRRVPAESLLSSAGAASGGGGGADSRNFSGSIPSNVVVVDQNGNRITVDPNWQNGEQSGVKKDYIGGAGATLVSETKVTRKLVEASGSEWKVNVSPGESRNWNFAIRMGEQKTANGTATLTLDVDGGASGNFKITSWEIVDDKGDRASVAPSATNPAEAVVTFTKGGEYNFTLRGETDWGSPFTVKGHGGVYP